MSSIETGIEIEKSSIEKSKFESRELIKSAMLHTSLMSFFSDIAFSWSETTEKKSEKCSLKLLRVANLNQKTRLF